MHQLLSFLLPFSARISKKFAVAIVPVRQVTNQQNVSKQSSSATTTTTVTSNERTERLKQSTAQFPAVNMQCINFYDNIIPHTRRLVSVRHSVLSSRRESFVRNTHIRMHAYACVDGCTVSLKSP